MSKEKSFKVSVGSGKKAAPQGSQKASAKNKRKQKKPAPGQPAVETITPETTVLSEALDFQRRLWFAEQQSVQFPVEVAFLFTRDGEYLDYAVGTAKQVRLSDEQSERVRGGILTHNHPDGSFFSWQDIALAHKLDLTELRAVRRGNPGRILIMRRPPDGWISVEEFIVVKEHLEVLNANAVLLEYKAKGIGLSLKRQKRLADLQWPSYLEEVLPGLGYAFESVLLQEPPQ